jgi:hypothetical protein
MGLRCACHCCFATVNQRCVLVDPLDGQLRFPNLMRGWCTLAESKRVEGCMMVKSRA